jgi:hypothetical protein
MSQYLPLSERAPTGEEHAPASLTDEGGHTAAASTTLEVLLHLHVQCGVAKHPSRRSRPVWVLTAGVCVGGARRPPTAAPRPVQRWVSRKKATSITPL